MIAIDSVADYAMCDVRCAPWTGLANSEEIGKKVVATRGLGQVWRWGTLTLLKLSGGNTGLADIARSAKCWNAGMLECWNQTDSVEECLGALACVECRNETGLSGGDGALRLLECRNRTKRTGVFI